MPLGDSSIMTWRAIFLSLAIGLLPAGLGAANVTRPASSAEPSAGAGDWPLLRGPNYDAHSRETGLVDSFPPEGPPVQWTRPLGAGYSGFVGSAGRVYTQYQTLGGQYVVCLDAKSGETLWQYRYEAAYDSAGMYPGPRATPALADGRVFFSSPRGLVGCLDPQSGRLVWSLNLFEELQIELVEFGYSCSPSPIGGKLLLPVGRPNASMVALDAATGHVLWHAGNDPISHVPALPIQLDGRQLVVGFLRNALAAFDLQTGEVVWRTALSQGYDEHAAWPIYREPYLWIAAPFRAGSELLELTADPAGVRRVWKSKRMSNDVCSSVLVDDCIYGFDIHDVQSKPHRPSRGQFRCIDFTTGGERWANGSATKIERGEAAESDSPAELPVGQATVLCADGKLILLNDLGELILARANPDRYEELGRSRVLGGEICWTQPMLLDGRLYVRNHSRAACLVLRDPRLESDTSAAKLSVADIPQTAYRDWAALILSVEPEYAMDLPTMKQIKLWYVDCLGLLLVAAVTATVLSKAVLPAGQLGRAIPPGDTAGVLANDNRLCRQIQVAVAFLLGALGTTLLSTWTQQFVFTWPLCLFAAFQATVYAAEKRSTTTRASRWWSRLLLVVFLLTCFFYFLLCRRLSLAPEWVFLSGFWAAVPLLWWARRQSNRVRFAALGELVLLLAAFTAYYWGSIGVLVWKYG